MRNSYGRIAGYISKEIEWNTTARRNELRLDFHVLVKIIPQRERPDIETLFYCR